MPSSRPPEKPPRIWHEAFPWYEVRRDVLVKSSGYWLDLYLGSSLVDISFNETCPLMMFSQKGILQLRGRLRCITSELSL